MRFLLPYSFASRLLPVGLVVGILVTMLVVWPGSMARADAPAVFRATFVQLWDRHDQWPQEQWNLLCADLSALGVQELIVQWSLRTEPAFFWRLTETRRKEVPRDRVEPVAALDRVVQAARQHGLRVRFGLTEDPAWWAEIRNEASVVEVFLNRLLQDQVALARTLVETYGQDSVFAGLYIPQEIDDQTWIDPARRECLEGHLARLSAALQDIRPNTNLAISCFATGRDDPHGFARYMAQLARAGGIAQVLYQDGLGTERLRFPESSMYLSALVPAVAQAGAHVRTVVEMFTPAPQTGFIPATMERIRAQLQQAYSLSGPDIVAFSFPDYAHPLGGPDAEQLWRAYRAYCCGTNLAQ